ncbi:MAG TPA: hypothetical protein PLL51_10145 [Bacteroidales bacterium]|nr:hypothetical protein [Bacteroidales bacterium]
MKTIIRVLLVFAVISAGGSFYPAAGQEKDGMVEYTPDFRFEDGIYLNFEQVKANKPIPKAKILTSTDYNDKDFFKNLLESDKIYFYDAMGVRQEINKSEIWAFARNGILYIQVQGNFNRITFIGSICHFVADVTSYDNRYYNYPYGYYDPYMSYPYYRYPYSLYSPYYYGNYYYPYGSYYSPYRNNVGRNELRQYLIDFDTGNVLEYDVENTELLLMKDQELYEEYMHLARKKRKDLMFVYIRKFNERNPLYIPSNQGL